MYDISRHCCRIIVRTSSLLLDASGPRVEKVLAYERVSEQPIIRNSEPRGTVVSQADLDHSVM